MTSFFIPPLNFEGESFDLAALDAEGEGGVREEDDILGGGRGNWEKKERKKGKGGERRGGAAKVYWMERGMVLCVGGEGSDVIFFVFDCRTNGPGYDGAQIFHSISICRGTGTWRGESRHALATAMQPRPCEAFQVTPQQPRMGLSTLFISNPGLQHLND